MGARSPANGRRLKERRIMDSLIFRLGLALAIGLLVGLERGWRERDAPEGSRTAGIRTFGISGLLGGLIAALADALDAVSVLVGGFIVFAAIFAWYKVREAAHDEDFSVTGVIAALACLRSVRSPSLVTVERQRPAGRRLQRSLPVAGYCTAC